MVIICSCITSISVCIEYECILRNGNVAIRGRTAVACVVVVSVAASFASAAFCEQWVGRVPNMTSTLTNSLKSSSIIAYIRIAFFI